jgi:REP element-mobilizing transposase RayT
MARPLRLEFSGAIYHLTTRGNARQKIFFSDADRQLFIDTLAGVVFRYGWICHAYCLMANHYHLLVETPKPNLSLGMRQINGIQSPPSASGTFVSGPIQGDFGGEGIVPVGALPLHCA